MVLLKKTFPFLRKTIAYPSRMAKRHGYLAVKRFINERRQCSTPLFVDMRRLYQQHFTFQQKLYITTPTMRSKQCYIILQCIISGASQLELSTSLYLIWELSRIGTATGLSSFGDMFLGEFIGEGPTLMGESSVAWCVSCSTSPCKKIHISLMTQYDAVVESI